MIRTWAVLVCVAVALLTGCVSIRPVTGSENIPITYNADHVQGLNQVWNGTRTIPAGNPGRAVVASQNWARNMAFGAGGELAYLKNEWITSGLGEIWLMAVVEVYRKPSAVKGQP